MSHAELLDIVNSTDPNTVLSVGNQLLIAGGQIQSLADDLHQNIAGLEWTGSAADSFRGWASQVVQATDTLADFTNTTATNIQMAGETLTNVKSSMPPLPTADMATVARYQQQPPVISALRVHGEPLSSSPAPGAITANQAKAAQANIDSLHQEAVTLMEKLGGSYSTAYSTIGATVVPTFPPPPVALMPPKGSGKLNTSANLLVQGEASPGAGLVKRGVGGSRSASGAKKESTAGSIQRGSGGGSAFVPVPTPVVGSGHPPGGAATTLQGTNSPVTSPNLPNAGGGNTAAVGGGTGGVTGGGGATIPPPGIGSGGGTGVLFSEGESGWQSLGRGGGVGSPTTGVGGLGLGGGSSWTGAGSSEGMVSGAQGVEGGSVIGGSAVDRAASRSGFGSEAIGEDVETGPGGGTFSESGGPSGGTIRGTDAAMFGLSTTRAGMVGESAASGVSASGES
ncbi:WXG100 family type VII secretion target [Streptacidiphilus albus]|uniref:WXG100 family type VII secretion target n=2 Tax=Streptacidiphilus albus TaxID=105425 RepID=UPI0012E0111C|nr:WXG100 family type VII secretion target [Streptacidiphilus albus]